jgi:hypothetical protein
LATDEHNIYASSIYVLHFSDELQLASMN